MRRPWISIVPLLWWCSVARAEPVPPVHTVTVDPVLGALGYTGRNIGDWAISYEHRLMPHHAVLVEQTTVHVHDDPFHLTLVGLGVGYRYHVWTGKSSPFVGAIVGGKIGFGRWDGTSPGDLGARAVFATAHVGWRWRWDNGWTITGRIGAGWARYRLGDDAPAEANAMRDDVLAPLPFELDSELGIGRSF